YNLPLALRMEGTLSPAALELCLQRLVERHEALRTRFAAAGGRPVQAIDPVDAGCIRLARVDLDGLPAGRRDAEVVRLVAEERRRGLALARGPRLRAALLRQAADDWGVLFTMHHVVSDGWSMELLVREVTALYSGLSEGFDPVLPTLPIQYADFAVWQRR